MILSPRGIAHVCKEDQLELTCTTTTNTILDWIIAIPGNAKSLRRSVSTTSVLTEIPLNSTRLIFSRTSEINADPLVSTLLISSVSADLNGTEVDCTAGGATLSTVVNVISDKNVTIGNNLDMGIHTLIVIIIIWHTVPISFWWYVYGHYSMIPIVLLLLDNKLLQATALQLILPLSVNIILAIFHKIDDDIMLDRQLSAEIYNFIVVMIIIIIWCKHNSFMNCILLASSRTENKPIFPK